MVDLSTVEITKRHNYHHSYITLMLTSKYETILSHTICPSHWTTMLRIWWLLAEVEALGLTNPFRPPSCHKLLWTTQKLLYRPSSPILLRDCTASTNKVASKHCLSCRNLVSGGQIQSLCNQWAKADPYKWTSFKRNECSRCDKKEWSKLREWM